MNGHCILIKMTVCPATQVSPCTFLHRRYIAHSLPVLIHALMATATGCGNRNENGAILPELSETMLFSFGLPVDTYELHRPTVRIGRPAIPIAQCPVAPGQSRNGTKCPAFPPGPFRDNETSLNAYF